MEGIHPEALHHTYVISGDRSQTYAQVVDFIENKCGVCISGNQDVFIKDYNSFYISDARDIRDLQRHTTLDTTKFFVLSMKDMTHQAQNAFLKIAEDPAQHTCFFILIPNYEMLLPTLRSRAVLVEHKGGEIQYRDVARKFLRSSMKDRLDIVESFHSKKKEHTDKEAIHTFLAGIEVELGSRHSTLHDVYEVKKKLQATGVSIKTLLEHLAVVLPQAK